MLFQQHIFVIGAKTCGTELLNKMFSFVVFAKLNFVIFFVFCTFAKSQQCRMFDICNRIYGETVLQQQHQKKLSLAVTYKMGAYVKTASFQLTSVSKNTIEQAIASNLSRLNDFFSLFRTLFVFLTFFTPLTLSFSSQIFSQVRIVLKSKLNESQHTTSRNVSIFCLFRLNREQHLASSK